VSTYAIGDIQGCYRTLQALLATVAFDAARDRLWLVGDLVGRGPASLDVLRWASDLGDRVVAVLGNHDLHLLAVDLGVREPRERDRLGPVLEAPDRAHLLDWLALRPLLHREDGNLLVHAGLHPSWSAASAESLAREIERALRGPERRALLAALQDPPNGAAFDTAHALRIMSSIRVCNDDGRIDFEYKGPPAEAPAGYHPWYWDRIVREDRILFGHWAAHGLHLEPGLVCLDSGCIWGRDLTALRLGDDRVFQHARVGDG
jgi:bis(5'-nucleosyl)-tetraphosphatase (symmetrical)